MRMAQSASPSTEESATTDRTLLPDDTVVEETPAGGLVYEPEFDGNTRIGRRLIGFTEVKEGEQLREELQKRGHKVGAMYHLPEFCRR